MSYRWTPRDCDALFPFPNATYSGDLPAPERQLFPVQKLPAEQPESGVRVKFEEFSPEEGDLVYEFANL